MRILGLEIKLGSSYDKEIKQFYKAIDKKQEKINEKDADIALYAENEQALRSSLLALSDVALVSHPSRRGLTRYADLTPADKQLFWEKNCKQG